jgi:hypothetical protein
MKRLFCFLKSNKKKITSKFVLCIQIFLLLQSLKTLQKSNFKKKWVLNIK